VKPLPRARAEAPLLGALDDALAPGGAAALDPDVPAAVWEAALVGPAAAFLARPGKDLRGKLVRAGWALGGGAALGAHAAPERLEHVIELIHAGSLIIDDVQDGSEERRGAPALHRLVGAPLAINTGSWMYFWALAELARLGVPGAVEHTAAVLARCHQGQALDLAARVVDLDPRDVPAVVAATTRLKTAALCRLAVELGARTAGAPEARAAALGDLGEAIGRALQMLDDLGGLVAPARRAKGHEDLREARPTWAWAWLAEQHDPFAWARLVGVARAVAAGADPQPLAEALAERVEAAGRAAARKTLDDALAATRAELGELTDLTDRGDRGDRGDRTELAVLDALAADLHRMESMYV
jgi:geranylgeranyl pyrophosphate synthase